MSLQSRLSALITAIGADIKDLRDTTTILDNATSVSESEQPAFAIEWREGGSGGGLVAKLVTISPIENSVVVDRSELWARVKSRSGSASINKLLLDSDGNSQLAGGYLARYFRTTTASQAATTTAILFDGTSFASHAWYSAANGRWTPQIAGYYVIGLQIAANDTTADRRFQSWLLKNGVAAPIAQGTLIFGRGSNRPSVTLYEVVLMNGTTDYLTFSMWSNTTPVPIFGNASGSETFFTAQLIRAT